MKRLSKKTIDLLKEHERIDNAKAYKHVYDAVYKRLEEVLHKEMLKRGTDTNTYLPEEWKIKD